MGNIERGGRQPCVPGVCLDDLDVRQPLFGHQLPRHGDVDRVDLESYVSGHHLQLAQTAYRAELLNRWQRLFCWVSGHGEGCALPSG